MPSTAEAQKKYREKTGSTYDKAYKRAEERAKRRLAHEFPKAYRRIFDEERAKEGLPPVQKRK